MKSKMIQVFMRCSLILLIISGAFINDCIASSAAILSVPKLSSFKKTFTGRSYEFKMDVGGSSTFSDANVRVTTSNEPLSPFSNNQTGLDCNAGCKIYYYVTVARGNSPHAKMLAKGFSEKYTIYNTTTGNEIDKWSIPSPPSIKITESENADFFNQILSNVTPNQLDHLCYGLGYIDDHGSFFARNDCVPDDGSGGSGSCSITNNELKFDFGDLKKEQANNSTITEDINIECGGDLRDYTLNANKIDLTNGMDVDFYLKNNVSVSSQSFKGSQSIPISAKLSGTPKAGEFKGNGVITLSFL